MKRYLSIKQICDLLPVCKSLVYRLVRDGVLPSTRLGGKILIPEDGIEAVLALGESAFEPDHPPPQTPVPEKPPRMKPVRNGQQGMPLW